MKKFKKLSSMALTAMMTATMTSPAFAASITVDGAINGETYNLYKIFDYTSNGAGAYSYTMPADSQWRNLVGNYTFDDDSNDQTEKVNAFTLTASQNEPETLVVRVNSAFDSETEAADFAKYLSENLTGKSTDASQEASADGVTFDVGDSLGYYFVDTSTGSLCGLFNNNTVQTLREKNELPTVEKKIVLTSDSGEVEAEATTASINESVKFRITVADGKGTDKAITIHDEMEAGMTLTTGSITVSDENGEVSEDNYEIKTSGLADDCTFEVELLAAYVQTLGEDDEVVVEYSAVLNKDAEIAPQTNDNTVNLSYSEQTITGNTVNVSAYQFDLVKVDTNKKLLTGAEFKLYDAETGGNEIQVTEESNGVYRVLDTADPAESADVIEAGAVTIKGLGNGTYYLEETAAPAGYNPLTARQPVKIENSNIAAETDSSTGAYTGGILVVNNTGSILPSTGGIGTTIFYAAGIVLMAGAVFFVVRRKRA